MNIEVKKLFPHIKQSFVNKVVNGLTNDSRQVLPGYVFFAIKGMNADGNEFIGEAIKKGASVIVSEKPLHTILPNGVDYLQVEEISKTYAIAAAEWFGNPAKRLKIYGFTGSNGKTTSTYLLQSVLQKNGNATSVIGTIGYVIGNKKIPATHTTPDAYRLNELLYQALKEGDTHVVMEVSSHSLALDRVYGIPFKGAVFTNFSQDHLDFHKDLEDYFQAKAKLFIGSGAADIRLVNNDNEYCRRLLQDRNILSFSIKNKHSNYLATNLSLNHSGIEFQVNGVICGTLKIESSLVGMYNVENILGVVALADRIGIDGKTIHEGIKAVKGIPGRMQRVPSNPNVAVLIDYAHTSDAMIKVITTARNFTKGKLRVCFGCGGNRDKTKRPLMGEAASLADCVYVTSDNPRFEDPEEIIQDILPGVNPAKLVLVEVDRKIAIQRACSDLEMNDVLLVLGKGAEDYIDIQGKKIPYSDFETVRASLKKTKWKPDDS
ncbi:MAG: UDP-N-acetylmuramoyl-L-alanyl-D-glutamate--2,6-diaminopimelate ligase [bacterium]|nr:UDP-N-acetylmuramoyl-L-alanyl-D-glutamate--2,6-diaminopimelate ligase [bacterium]